MINKFLSWPIRTHLTILLVLLAIPPLWLTIHSGIDQRNEAIDEAKMQCLRLVDTIATEQQAVAAGVQQLVTAIGLLPEVQSHNPKATNVLLVELLKKNPHYANIGIADKSGLFWASATPFQGKLSVADRKYYQDSVRTGMFSSGEYTIARTVKRAVMNFGYPVKNASNELISVIVVGLDLDYAQRNFEKINLPTGASFSLLDHQGTILIRNRKDVFSEKLVGRRDIIAENFTKAKEGPDEGTFESMGNDGKSRLVAYKRISLPHEPKPYLYIRSSIPLASVTWKANTAMVKNMVLLALLFGAGLSIVWVIGKHVIVSPIMLLKNASEQLAAGADTVNVSHVVKGGELGELARAFDGMAVALTQREADLRESQERWATTLASIGDAVIATDVAGNITFMNAVAEGLTGWTLHDAAARPVAEVFNIINEHTRREVDNPVTRVLDEGMIVGLANHTVLARKDGTEVPIDDSGAPIRDRDGRIMGVVLVFRDITERKTREGELFRLNRTLKALSDSNQAMMRAESETGYLRDICRIIVEDCGHSMVWIGFAEDDKDKTVRPAVCAGFEEGYLDTLNITWADTERGRGPTGTAIRTGKPSMCRNMFTDPLFEPWREQALKRGYASSTVFPMIANGKTLGALTIYSRQIDAFSEEQMNLLTELANDVAYGLTAIRLREDKARADEALRKAHGELELRVQERTLQLSQAYEALQREMGERRQAEEHLRQAQKMEAIGTLAGGIAHDFNNILAAIIGFTEMAVDDVPDRPMVERNLQNVMKSAMRARELVKQILTFSRKTSFDRSPMALSPVVKETVQLLRASIPTTIDIRLSTRATSDTVLAAPVEIQQILMNLATNASLAMQEKGGSMEVSLTDIDLESDSFDVAPGEYIQLVVKDTGCGMTPDVMKRVFEPFFTTREIGKGTGMGLAVVYGIVKDLNGTMAVESELGVGSTFRALLPKVHSFAKADAAHAAEIPGGTEKILFVDDEYMLVEWGQKTLERLGYKVVAMTDSVEALRTFSSDPSLFDLVITDQTMPKTAGSHLATELLKLRPDIPIILCTGHSETVSPERAREIGIKEFLTKPLIKQELALAVRRVLDGETRDA